MTLFNNKSYKTGHSILVRIMIDIKVDQYFWRKQSHVHCSLSKRQTSLHNRCNRQTFRCIEEDEIPRHVITHLLRSSEARQKNGLRFYGHRHLSRSLRESKQVARIVGVPGLAGIGSKDTYYKLFLRPAIFSHIIITPNSVEVTRDDKVFT